MKVNYKYNGPSQCINNGGQTTLGLSPDLSRDEKVSFRGKLKNPLVFRDAMLMLREIVISDSTIKKKERKEFFQWLEQEIENRIQLHEQYLPDVRAKLESELDNSKKDLEINTQKIKDLTQLKNQISKEIAKYDAWKDYYAIERNFWTFIKNRDLDLWFVLDPVITVHPDAVSFEAFSVDESTYGCLTIENDEFTMLSEPKLGTTNIDFSAKLARSMERFRTYTDVELSVNPEGFAVDTGITPEHIEKKIDLPESWVKGFNQVSSAANLGGLNITLSPVDIYDICSFLRRNKENKSPRYMKWVLEKDKRVKIIFEPFGKELVLNAIYTGDKKREEKIWGRRRWLVMEKLLPLAKSFEIKLLGFGLPQFIIADLGKMKMTIGFSSWSSNDWVKGTAFNIMSGFIGEGNYNKVYTILKENRFMSISDIIKKAGDPTSKTMSGIGYLLKKGEGYFDPINNVVRFRRLFAEDIPYELYKTTDIEYRVNKHIEAGLDNFTISINDKNEFVFKNKYKAPNEKYRNYNYRNTEDYNKQYKLIDTEINIDEDGQISALKCECRDFNKGPRNISAPCEHILSLYTSATKFTKLKLDKNKEYKINDIMEMLL